MMTSVVKATSTCTRRSGINCFTVMEIRTTIFSNRKFTCIYINNVRTVAILVGFRPLTTTYFLLYVPLLYDRESHISQNYNFTTVRVRL